MTAALSERRRIVASIRESAAGVRTMLAEIRDTALRSRATIDASRAAIRHLDDDDPWRGPRRPDVSIG
jgi:hypothetical protein